MRDIEVLDVESIKGKIKDIKDYFRNEITKQSKDKNISFEEFITNGKMILELLEQLEEEEENKIIIVNYNPMGALYYEFEGVA